LQAWHDRLTIRFVKTVTVRLPAALVADLETESRERHCSKSDIVRERLTVAARSRLPASRTATIADLIGSVRGLPTDLSRRKKAYLKTTGYGRKRSR
jgi:hypothetical protein